MSGKYGIFIQGVRPTSKRAVKEGVENMPHRTYLESTSDFDTYSGMVEDAPDGEYSFVGPDPRSNRAFYGTITKTDGKVRVA